MDKQTRSAIEAATRGARVLLEGDFRGQLDGDFDIRRGEIAGAPGAHLTPRKVYQRERIVAALGHKRATGMSADDAVTDYIRDAAFTTLNRFIALKMLERRGLVQECVTRGEQSSGYGEFCGLAPGLPLLPDSAGYRLYIESLFDELSTEVKVLFDRRDPASVLWPRRATFERLLAILNDTTLDGVWGEDETIGWVYQYFNSTDERRQLRDESQAPRNSRELAIRNQFFTPRYVVQFLTDNTLGRIWYEMRGTKTALAERCEYLVRRPGETFEPRRKKDPRDLRILDPACGSGHFLLYAFDLLVTIYEEAHADPDSPVSEATGQRLAQEYPDLPALRAELPGLVLRHNLHGIDIDPRCAQIAQLALWLRAQRAYDDLAVPRAERPPIRRTNIVLAEPLVADDDVAKDFLARLDDEDVAAAFTELKNELTLAGDLGVLLRIETRRAALEPGYAADLLVPPEERLRKVLTSYEADDDTRANARRRLFAEDTAQGLGLLAITAHKYDVVLMNPPFGSTSSRAKALFDKAYPRTRNDIYAAFVERGIELLTQRGRLGAITSRTGFFLTRFRAWREEILLKAAPPVVVADLGQGVLDTAMVETAAYCLELGRLDEDASAVFIRALAEPRNKASIILDSLNPGSAHIQTHFEVTPQIFKKIPGSPFTYWISDSWRRVFQTMPSLEGAGVIARQGMSTANDFRFIRAWWAVPPAESGRSEKSAVKWIPLAKGGRHSPFYYDVHLTVNWAADGRELKADIAEYRGQRGWGYHWTAALNGHSHYFRAGLTWPGRSQRGLSIRALPEGCIFGTKGPSIFVDGDREGNLLALLAVTNSTAFRCLVDLQMAFGSFEVGVIQRTPIPEISNGDRARLAMFARRAYDLKWRLDVTEETSHAFLLPAVLIRRNGSFEFKEIEEKLEEVRHEIDLLAFKLYRVEDEQELGRSESPASNREFDADGDGETDDDNATHEMPADLASRLISWLVGVSFDRFDMRLATGDRAIPSAPDPFDALPVRSPGMWPVDESRPETPPDVLVDDPGHVSDVSTLVSAGAARVNVDLPGDLRQWLARGFFPFHIRMYSKSRRKAPIYWQLATPSASYSVWLYIHAFTRDTMFRVQNDYVVPKLRHEESRLAADSVPWSGVDRIAFSSAFSATFSIMPGGVRVCPARWVSVCR